MFGVSVYCGGVFGSCVNGVGVDDGGLCSGGVDNPSQEGCMNRIKSLAL